MELEDLVIIDDDDDNKKKNKFLLLRLVQSTFSLIALKTATKKTRNDFGRNKYITTRQSVSPISNKTIATIVFQKKKTCLLI